MEYRSVSMRRHEQQPPLVVPQGEDNLQIPTYPTTLSLTDLAAVTQ